MYDSEAAAVVSPEFEMEMLIDDSVDPSFAERARFRIELLNRLDHFGQPAFAAGAMTAQVRELRNGTHDVGTETQRGITDA